MLFSIILLLHRIITVDLSSFWPISPNNPLKSLTVRLLVNQQATHILILPTILMACLRLLQGVQEFII
jgi:hypothetical protein